METAPLRALAEPQLRTFADNDYVTAELFEGITAAIERDFPDGNFSFVDIGGGRGLFADRLLARFPGAHGAVLDNSELLLYMNESHARKELILASATDIRDVCGARRFDVAFFNLSLHHFVAGTYVQSRSTQRYALERALGVLSPRGRIVVTENLFEGFAIPNLSGRIVYFLTSSKTLAPIVGRLGANTAGCGVCFLSADAWRREFRDLHLQELQFGAQRWHETELKKRLCLRLMGVRSVSRAFFVLAPAP